MKLSTLSFVTVLVLVLAPSAGAAPLTVDCGGGAMFLDIQTAINNSSPGDVIVVRPCGGYPDGFVVSSRTDLQIVGAEALNVTGAYPVGAGMNPVTIPQVFDNNSTCVHIEDSDNISVVGLSLGKCLDDGFHIFESDRINIQGNTLYWSGARGVYIEDSRDVQVAGNFLSGALVAGIRVEQRGEHVNIQNNRVLKNRVGIHAQGRNVDIINNEVWSNTGTGIIVDNDWSKVSRNTVLNNGGGFTPQIDFSSQPPDTCLVGNRTNSGIVPWMIGCQEDND